MLPRADRFPPDIEALFRTQRCEALAVINSSTYWLVAALVLVFSAWDAYVDPAHWLEALVWRLVGILVIVATGLIQRRSGRIDWAPALAKTRFAASTLAVAAALAVVRDGFVVGLAGLVAVFFAGPYIAIDRRDYLKLNALPFAAVALLMWALDLDRFTVINAWCFLLLSLAVGLLLARVFEASNRRAFSLEQALSREARTDALTGIANRRALDELGVAELRRSARNGAPVSLVLLDIDYFKRINDTHGHQVGDQIIQAVVEVLKGQLRATDSIGRWGGEEFLAILPETGNTEALQLAERLRAAVAAAELSDNPRIASTISLGVSTADSVDDPAVVWQAQLKLADAALYRAKDEGRNRVAGT